MFPTSPHHLCAMGPANLLISHIGVPSGRCLFEDRFSRGEWIIDGNARIKERHILLRGKLDQKAALRSTKMGQQLLS